MSSPLFTPLRIGSLTLSHRIVMAPMTRLRATTDGVVTEVTAEYYSQRSKVPGTLIISEGTAIAAEAGGFPNLPGIYNDAQAAAWKKVVEAVHANNSTIYLQIAALGRVGSPEALHAAGHPYVSSSPTKLSSKSETPTELSISEIKRYVKMFGEAARRGVHEAGVDGIELHACHGSLVDQFIQDVVNKRTDQYGGSVENRSRFVLEVIDAIVSEIGAQRTGIRLSPWSTTQEMGMRNPIPTYSYIVSQLVQRHPELAYVHVVEPGREGTLNGLPQALDEGASNDFIYQLWAPRPYLTAGGYDTTSAAQAVQRLENTGVVFGQLFISNPDLPVRIRNGVELASSDKTTHYALGPEFTKGYIDYPSASVPVLA